MSNVYRKFKSDGYAIFSDVLSEEKLKFIEIESESIFLNKAGTRNLLEQNWIKNIATEILKNQKIRELISNECVPVQCTYFEKNLDANWLVALHRDLSIPVKKKINIDRWKGWSVKQGINFVQPPREILEKLVAVRLHLEENTIENGGLQIVPGSHVDLEKKQGRIVCDVPKGGVLIMRPLLLHASSKLVSGSRRVLHFLYGPRNLPNGIEWNYG